MKKFSKYKEIKKFTKFFYDLSYKFYKILIIYNYIIIN